MTQAKYLFPFLLILACTAHNTFGQIAYPEYPDSCLSIGLYYQNNTQWDTAKTIEVKDKDISRFFYDNDSLLNLFVLFKNNCSQHIAIPSEIRLDAPGDNDFAMEGYRIHVDGADTLRFNVEYDYHEPRGAPYILKQSEIKHLKYPFSLGFVVNKKGSFRFRLRFYNSYNHNRMNDWKYYYSNWIYLTIV